MSNAVARFTFTTVNQLPANGKVRITFPYWNPLDSSPSNMVLASSPTFANSNILSPSQTNVVFNSGTNILQIDNVISTTQAAGTQFSFTIGNIQNPYNSKPKTGIVLTTLNSAGGSIDQASLSYTVTTPASF